MSVNSYVDGTVFVTTPAVNNTARHLSIEIVLNQGSRIRASQTFEYRNNPVFTDINPRNHLIV